MDGVLSVNTVYQLKAQTPYIIYAPEDMDELKFYNVADFNNSTDPADLSVEKNGVTFQGTYTPIVAPDTQIKAISFDGEDATGIAEVATGELSSTAIYNLAGQRISKAQNRRSTNVKGVYIIGGKKKLLVLLMLLCPAIASAQDVIVKKDGSTIVCRVEKVSDTDVTYKLWSDLKGSSFVMDKSLVSAINYENGKKETFSEATNLYTPNNQNNSVQALNNKALLEMDYKTNGNPYKKVKWLRTIGWIGGGAIAAVGIGSIAMGSGLPNSSGICIGAGVAGIVLGVGVTTTCLVIAHNKKKKLDAALQTSSLYRYDIPFSNGSSLSVGADMLHDRIMDKRTVGLGLSYNF